MDEIKQNIPKQERTPNQKSGIHLKDGKYFMYLKDEGEVVVSRRAGKMMRLALWLNMRKNQKHLGEKALNIFKKLNCHKTVFTILDFLDIEHLEERKNYELNILDKKYYKEFGKFEQLEEQIKKTLGNSLGIVQVARNSEYGLAIKHSCICGVSSLDKIICFGKEGYREKDLFEVVGLEDLYNRECSFDKWLITKIENINEDVLDKINNYTDEDEKNSAMYQEDMYFFKKIHLMATESIQNNFPDLDVEEQNKLIKELFKGLLDYFKATNL